MALAALAKLKLEKCAKMMSKRNQLIMVGKRCVTHLYNNKKIVPVLQWWSDKIYAPHPSHIIMVIRKNSSSGRERYYLSGEREGRGGGEEVHMS